MGKEQGPTRATAALAPPAHVAPSPRPVVTPASSDGRTSTELDGLMDRYAAGEAAAFREIHRQLAPRLRMFLLRLSGEPRTADDLVQEAFLRMHRARGTFTRGAAVVPWSYAIARNVYIDHARSKQGKNRASASLDDLPEGREPRAESGTAPDAELAAKEMLGIVRTTLAKLPETHREAFILVRFEGMSIAEAALVLDTSEANVKVRAFRAYEAFRAALKEGEKK